MIKDDPLIKSIVHSINEKLYERKALVCRGKVTSFDEYKKQVGFIEALESSLVMIDECIKNYGHEEDDD